MFLFLWETWPNWKIRALFTIKLFEVQEQKGAYFYILTTFCNQNNLSVFNVLVCIQHCLQYVCPQTVEMQLGYVNAREYHFTGRRHWVYPLGLWRGDGIAGLEHHMKTSPKCSSGLQDSQYRSFPTRHTHETETLSLMIQMFWVSESVLVSKKINSESQSQSRSRACTPLGVSLGLKFLECVLYPQVPFSIISPIYNTRDCPVNAWNYNI